MTIPPIVSEALARIVARRGGLKTPISLLVFAAVVFRAELAVYLAALSAFLIYERRISVAKFVTIGAISSLCSLGGHIVVHSLLVLIRALSRSAYHLGRLVFLADLADMARNARHYFQRRAGQKRRLGGMWCYTSIFVVEASARCLPSISISPTHCPGSSWWHCLWHYRA